MAEVMIPRRSRDLMETLSPEDFETASIRSAAPSYCSEAPSSHYTVPNSSGGALPPYAPPATSASASNRRNAGAVSNGAGRRNELPNLAHFRIPTWSNVSSNPAARHYHSVALRRAAAAEHASAAAEIGCLMRRLAVLERFEQEEASAASRRTTHATATNRIGNGRAVATRSSGGRNSSSRNSSFRPLEDPYLVGEVAARRARSERLARETRNSYDDPLVREDRRWDWFLGQMKGRHGLGVQPRLRRQFDLTILSPTMIRHIHARRM